MHRKPLLLLLFLASFVLPTLAEKPATDLLPEGGVSYRKYGMGVVVPFIGADYGLTERMSLTFKADYMLPLGSSHFDFPSGPRCYVGFMFNH